MRNVSGKEVVKILCNKFGFEVTGRKGSHIRLSKITTTGKVGTAVPMHSETLRLMGTISPIKPLSRIFAFFSNLRAEQLD